MHFLRSRTSLALVALLGLMLPGRGLGAAPRRATFLYTGSVVGEVDPCG